MTDGCTAPSALAFYFSNFIHGLTTAAIKYRPVRASDLFNPFPLTTDHLIHPAYFFTARSGQSLTK